MTVLSDEQLQSVYRQAQKTGMGYDEALNAGLRAVADAAIAAYEAKRGGAA